MTNEATGELLSTVPTAELINALWGRDLSPEDIAFLQQLTSKASEGVHVPGSMDESVALPEDRAEVFARQVIARNVYGKVYDDSGFQDYGPDNVPLFDTEEGLGNLVSRLYNHYGDQINRSEYNGYHYVYVGHSRELPGMAVVRISFLRDKCKATRMNYLRNRLAVVFPQRVADEFMEAIQRDPDLLEEFYQRVFPGLESESGPKEEPEKMHRVKAKGFCVVTPEDVEGVTGNSYMGASEIEGRFRKLKMCFYARGPYGTGLLPG